MQHNFGSIMMLLAARRGQRPHGVLLLCGQRCEQWFQVLRVLLPQACHRDRHVPP